MRPVICALLAITALSAGCGHGRQPRQRRSPSLAGTLQVTSSSRDSLATLGDTFALAVTDTELQFGDGAGALTMDTARSDGGRHVEAHRVRAPSKWMGQSLEIGMQCDLWPERKAGWCQVGVAGTDGVAEIQGEARFR